MSRKGDILRVATKLFKQQGKESTSIRQIASDASVSHSLLHKHWVSKDALYLDCLSSETTKLSELIDHNDSRSELTIYYLLKHPSNWSLIARCLSISPPSSGEERRFETKVRKLINPVLDKLLDISKSMGSNSKMTEVEIDQTSKTVFFLILSVFSGHCLLQRTLTSYLGEADLKACRRIAIDAFYENYVFKINKEMK